MRSSALIQDVSAFMKRVCDVSVVGFSGRWWVFPVGVSGLVGSAYHIIAFQPDSALAAVQRATNATVTMGECQRSHQQGVLVFLKDLHPDSGVRCCSHLALERPHRRLLWSELTVPGSVPGDVLVQTMKTVWTCASQTTSSWVLKDLESVQTTWVILLCSAIISWRSFVVFVFLCVIFTARKLKNRKLGQQNKKKWQHFLY